MAKLFHMANEVPKTTTHDNSSEADYNGQEMKMSVTTAMMTALMVWTLAAWSTNWLMSAASIGTRPLSDWEPSYKGKRSGCVYMGNRTLETQKRMGSAVVTQCPLFDLEGAMTDPTQIRDKILTMETITLRHDPLAVPHVHESTVAAMSVIGFSTGNVCKVFTSTLMAVSKRLKVMPLMRRRGHSLSWNILEQNTAAMVLLRDR